MRFRLERPAPLHPLTQVGLLVGFPLLCLAATSARTTAMAPPPDPIPARGLAMTPPVDAVVKGPGLYRITPERRAALDTIRYAEGTWNGGSVSGYLTLYGGGRFKSMARHPDVVVVRRYASAAAGAYQFLPATWRAAQSRLGLSGFGPASQDQAALDLVERRGALAAIDRGVLCDRTLDKLSREWASFPMVNGASAYGQPAKTASALRLFHQRMLETRRRDAGLAA